LAHFFFQGKKKQKGTLGKKSITRGVKIPNKFFNFFGGKKTPKGQLLYDHHAFNKSCHLLELWVIVFCFFFFRTKHEVIECLFGNLFSFKFLPP
jgi:hypothetical protein